MSDVTPPTPPTQPTPSEPMMDTQTKALLGASVATLFVPAVALTAAVVRVVSRYGRVPASTLLIPFTVLFAVAFALSGFPDVLTMVDRAFTAWSGLFDSTNPAGLGDLLTAGGWWAVVIGFGVGVLWTWLGHDEDLRPGPLTWWKARKLAAHIRTHTFPTAVTLGVLADNPTERVAISPRTANGHLLITGATGAGKTVGVLSTIVDAAAQGDAVVYIDLKGGDTVPDFLAGLALKLGKPFHHFSLFDSSFGYHGPSASGPATYNPAGYGDATRRKDLLTKACGSTVEFYKNMTADYVQVAFAVLLANDPTLGGQSAVAAVSNVLDPRALERVAATIPKTHKDAARLQQATAMFADQLRNREFMSSLKTFQTYLSLFTNSIVGPFITAGQDCIEFSDVDETGAIVCFSLNSSLYGDLAGRLATLIVEDLTTYAGTRFSSGSRPFRLVVDEFAVIDSANLLNLISRGREAGMCVTLATQTLADLEEKSPAFKGQVIDNVAGFVVFRANSEADARTYSGLTGDIDADGGYAVAWQQFLSVDRGQCWFINKTPQTTKRLGRSVREEAVVKVDVIPRVVPPVHRYHDEPVASTTPAYLAGDWLVGETTNQEDTELLTALLTETHDEPDTFPTLVPDDVPEGTDDGFTGLSFPTTTDLPEAVNQPERPRKTLRDIQPAPDPVEPTPPAPTPADTEPTDSEPTDSTPIEDAPEDHTPKPPAPAPGLHTNTRDSLPLAPPPKRRRSIEP